MTYSYDDLTEEDRYRCYDAFITKVNATGSRLLYSSFLGGSTDDGAYTIALPSDSGDDQQGTASGVYIAGGTDSRNFPTTVGAYDRTQAGGTCGSSDYRYLCNDGFVTQLNGSRLSYSTLLGGGRYESVSEMAVGAGGNAYLVGDTDSWNFPTTAGAHDRTRNGATDVFVTRLNSAGSRLTYSTFVGGQRWDYGSDIELDWFGNAYITGSTVSQDFPTTAGAYDRTYNGGDCGDEDEEGKRVFSPCADVFVTKLSSTGSRVSYSTYLGGTHNDWGTPLALQQSSAGRQVYLAGTTSSTDFPTTVGAYDRTYNETVEEDYYRESDVFVMKLQLP